MADDPALYHTFIALWRVFWVWWMGGVEVWKTRIFTRTRCSVFPVLSCPVSLVGVPGLGSGPPLFPSFSKNSNHGQHFITLYRTVPHPPFQPHHALKIFFERKCNNTFTTAPSTPWPRNVRRRSVRTLSSSTLPRQTRSSRSD